MPLTAEQIERNKRLRKITAEWRRSKDWVKIVAAFWVEDQMDKERKRQWLELNKMPEKAKILKVGTFDDKSFKGWHFERDGKDVEFTNVSGDGEWTLGGYTMAELREIAAHSTK